MRKCNCKKLVKIDQSRNAQILLSQAESFLDKLLRVSEFMPLSVVMEEDCLECVEKHIGAAHEQFKEVPQGYPEHILSAIGNLVEAQNAATNFPEIAAAIREARISFQRKGEIPDLVKIELLVLDAKQTQEAGK